MVSATLIGQHAAFFKVVKGTATYKKEIAET